MQSLLCISNPITSFFLVPEGQQVTELRVFFSSATKSPELKSQTRSLFLYLTAKYKLLINRKENPSV